VGGAVAAGSAVGIALLARGHNPVDGAPVTAPIASGHFERSAGSSLTAVLVMVTGVIGVTR
jgi:hypothetical protein